jgi:hypothetical protein
MTHHRHQRACRAAAIGWLTLSQSVVTPVDARPPIESSVPINPLHSGTLELLPAARSLEQMINQMRIRQGRPELLSLPEPLQQANRVYGRKVLLALLAHGGCEHDRPLWQGFQRRMQTTEVLMPMSEVLACPRAKEGWSSLGVINSWQKSPFHNAILFERDDRSHFSCAVADRETSMAALCTLWKRSPPRPAP